MSTATLPINRTRPEPVTVSSDHWIRLEEIEEPPLTVSEAANLIDEVFDIDPCDPDIQMAKPKEEDSAPTEEEFEDAVKEEFDLALCKMDLFGGGHIKVKITQSHPENPYKLRISFGRIGDTIRKAEMISFTTKVENATQVELESPCAGNDSFNWLTSTKPQPIKRTGNTLHWEYPATGTIGGSYLTSFDEVEVYVPQETELLAFGVKCFDKITLHPPPNPDIDEINRKKEKYCPEDNLGSSTESGDDPPDPPIHITREEWRCICSGEHAYYTYPAGYGSASEYTGNVIFDDKFGGYVDCGEETGDISDPDFYLQVCCEKGPADLPRCKKRYVKNPGGKAVKREIVERYGTDGVEYIAVSPEDGDCGSTIYEQVQRPKNCCDEVETAVYLDKDSMAEVLPHNSHIRCRAKGGRGEYTYRTSAQGTFFANKKKVIKSPGYVVLYADVNFCGSTILSVSDECTSDSMVIRSDKGEWVKIPYDESIAQAYFKDVNPVAQWAVVGNYKFYEHGEFVYLPYEKILSPLPDADWTFDQACAHDIGGCYHGEPFNPREAQVICANRQGFSGYPEKQTIMLAPIIPILIVGEDPVYIGEYRRSPALQLGGDVSVGYPQCPFWGSSPSFRLVYFEPKPVGNRLYQWSCSL